MLAASGSGATHGASLTFRSRAAYNRTRNIILETQRRDLRPTAGAEACAARRLRPEPRAENCFDQFVFDD